MDRHLGASFTQKASQTRCVSRAPHANEILSLRGRVNGTSTEETLQSAWPESFIRRCSLNDTDDGGAAGSGICISEDVGMDRQHQIKVAERWRGANIRSGKTAITPRGCGVLGGTCYLIPENPRAVEIEHGP